MVEHCYEALNKCSLSFIIGFVMKETGCILAFVKNSVYGAKEDAPHSLNCTDLCAVPCKER